MTNKLYVLAFIGWALLACSSSGGLNKPADKSISKNAGATIGETVATREELPECNNENLHQVMIISSTNQVVVCQDNDWSETTSSTSNELSSNIVQVYTTEASLPVCNSNIENSLAFISSSASMLVCTANSWTGVGSSDQESNNNKDTYGILDSEDLAEPCSATNQGELNYIIQDKKFIYCSNNAWTDADISGNGGNQVSEKWREVWNENVMSTAIIISGYSLYNNAAIDAGNLNKVHRFYDNNPAAATDRCTFNSSGSGFVVGQNLMATNAHVANTWMTTSLGSLIGGCSLSNETQDEFLNAIFDFCIVPAVPTFAQGTILANTPFRLSEFLNSSAIFTDDYTLQAVSMQCYDGVDRTLGVSTPFAELTLYVGNQVTAGVGGTPTLNRTLQIDTFRSLVTLRPSQSLAGMHVIYPNAQGIIDDSNFANWIPVINIDMSVGGSDDLALLQVETGQRKPVTLSDVAFSNDILNTENTRLNEDVLLIGYSRGDLYAHFVTGNINQAIRFDQMVVSSAARDGFFTSDNRVVYMYDLVSGGGSSGGPIFNLDGEAVAYNFAGDVPSVDTDFGYGLQVSHLRALLIEPRAWLSPQALPELNRTP